MTITAVRYATLNGVPLDTFGWRVKADGYSRLLDGPPVRGEDITIPTASGVRAYPRVVTASTVSIDMVINGNFTENGSVNTDPIQGMLQNRDYLRANIGFPGTSGVDADRGTVELVLVRAGALANVSAEVTVLGLTGFRVRGKGLADIRIDLSIPSGELTA